MLAPRQRLVQGAMNNRVLLASCGMALCPKLAYAHGGGLFTLFVGVPLAAVLFIVSAVIVRAKYRHVRSGPYWGIAISLLVPWLFIYLAAVIGLLDAGFVKALVSGYYTREYLVSIGVACVPLIWAIGMRLLIWRSARKPLRGSV